MAPWTRCRRFAKGGRRQASQRAREAHRGGEQVGGGFCGFPFIRLIAVMNDVTVPRRKTGEGGLEELSVYFARSAGK